MIGDWRVLPESGQLVNGDNEQRLEPKAMAVLTYLAENAGNIVTRANLEDSIWKGSIVTYEALSVTINKIRSALGDDSRDPKFIETLAKRGYRLIAPTSLTTAESDPKLLASQSGMKTTAIVILLIFLGLFAGFFVYQTSRSTDDDHQIRLPKDIPSIAVIPFENLSNDVSQDYFAKGMTEYLITDLSRFSSLLVTSRSSTSGFSSQNLDIKKTSQILNVRYLVTGSVFKNKNRLRVAVQLIDTQTGLQHWANRFDRKLDDLFTVQDEITRQIVTELVKKVGYSKHDHLSRNYTNNLKAHDYFIRGNALYTSISKEGNSLARDMFLKAIEMDSDFVSAYSAIALTYVDDYRRKWGEDPTAAVDHAFEYANKAISIDTKAAVAYVVQAYALLYGRKKPEKAIRSAQTAITLYPNYADAYAIMASSYSFIGRSVDAIRINLHAMRLNPTSSYVYYTNLGRDYYFLNQPDKAIENLQSAIFRNDNYLNAHLYLAATYAGLGNLDDADWEVQIIQNLDPEFSLRYWAGTQPYQSKPSLERMLADLRIAGVPD